MPTVGAMNGLGDVPPLRTVVRSSSLHTKQHQTLSFFHSPLSVLTRRRSRLLCLAGWLPGGSAASHHAHLARIDDVKLVALVPFPDHKLPCATTGHETTDKARLIWRPAD